MSARLMFIALAMLLATAPAQARRSAEPSTGLSAIHFNQPPPDFTFVAENGEPQRLSALLGKPVVINFWTTWCHACIDEMPAFEQLQRRYGDRVAFITLSNEPSGTARSYLAHHNLRLPLLEDPNHAIFSAYSIAIYPVTIVVNARGRVSYVSVGGLDWSELRAAVDTAF
ncbi:MAG: TlpA family protein disulfide reductase [Candidatus Eremiobacteraeota bacterium]|nr:TlpA family protein disulfide reductase [Candidatus Eremiobacteraeota bacterium]